MQLKQYRMSIMHRAYIKYTLKATPYNTKLVHSGTLIEILYLYSLLKKTEEL